MDIYFRLGVAVAGASHALVYSSVAKENNETRERVARLTTLSGDGLILELTGPAMLHD